MSGGKLPLSVVQPVAQRLRDRLAAGCERIEFAGSLRRAGLGDPLLGDLELVAIPQTGRLQFGIPAERQVNALEAILLDLIAQGVIRRLPVELARPAWGPRYKKFWAPVDREWLQVDLFLADRANWGAIFTIRTGSDAFSRALVTHIRYKTPYVQDDGYLRVQASSEVVPVPEEADYFAAAGVQWVEPVTRNGPADVVPIRNCPVEGDQVPRRDQQQQLTLF